MKKFQSLINSYICFLIKCFQIHLDPFEEIGMAEKNAEQHRRSANEKEVCILWLVHVEGC